MNKAKLSDPSQKQIFTVAISGSSPNKFKMQQPGGQPHTAPQHGKDGTFLTSMGEVDLNNQI